jgi:hypothetical protein
VQQSTVLQASPGEGCSTKKKKKQTKIKKKSMEKVRLAAREDRKGRPGVINQKQRRIASAGAARALSTHPAATV